MGSNKNSINRPVRRLPSQTVVGYCLFAVAGTFAFGQTQVLQSPQQPSTTTQQPGTAGVQLPATIRPDYVLGPNDQVFVRVPQEEQMNERPFRVDADGYMSLPIVGRIRAAGLTVQALETEVAQRLRQFIVNPLVSITVIQYRSEPVFFVGAFRTPGIYPLQGRQTLVEMLAAVGGTLPNASRRIRVTRRSEYGTIPLPQAVTDRDKKTSSVEISMQSLTEKINPEEDLVLRAYDIVSVDRAERVYVNGEVTRVSAIELGERDSISIAQALTEAGGFTQTAARDRVMVLRPVLGTNRRAAFEIDLKRVFEGKDIDFPLLPNDILYVPRSTTRSTLVPIATSMVSSIPFMIVALLTR
jgi:polysaccharide export outer membrane protein